MRLRGRLFGGCRVLLVLKGNPVVEVVDWFGAVPPLTEEIRLAKPLSLRKGSTGFERGSLRYSLMDPPGRLPTGLSLAGVEPRVRRRVDLPRLGMYWNDIKRASLVAWAERKGKEPSDVLEREEARLDGNVAKKEGLSRRAYRLRVQTHEILEKWRVDEYDNYKDPCAEIADLLPKLTAELPKEAAALRKVKNALTRELKALLKDPVFATEAKACLVVLTREASTATARDLRAVARR
jgi:hypothetical protein